MDVTKKILKKVAVIVESVYGTYVAPTYLLGFTAYSGKQGFGMIEDAGIVGTAFKGLPAQGLRKVDGSIEVQTDAITLPPLLEAGIGANAANVFTIPLTENSKSLSICALDAVKTNKEAGISLDNCKLASAAESDLKFSADISSPIAEVRDGTAFPTVTYTPGTRFLHQHLGGANGYFRIGDQADALASGDNINVKSVELGWKWNFDFDAVNSQQALQQQSGQGEVSFKFQIPEHSADTYHAFRDARTKLQVEYLYYASATARLKIQIPNLIISDIAPSDDAKMRLDVTCMVGRNGLGSTYENGNMTFVNPLKITLTNA